MSIEEFVEEHVQSTADGVAAIWHLWIVPGLFDTFEIFRGGRQREALTKSATGASVSRVSPRVVVIDNYDSFTYNLVQYFEELGASCDVRLNDHTTAAEVE